jgi:hypothetical protein
MNKILYKEQPFVQSFVSAPPPHPRQLIAWHQLYSLLILPKTSIRDFVGMEKASRTSRKWSKMSLATTIKTEANNNIIKMVKEGKKQD